MRLSKPYIIEGKLINKNSLVYDKVKLTEQALSLSLCLRNLPPKLKENYDTQSFAYKQLKKTGNMDDEYGLMVCEAVLELLDVFSMQGHSGFSAPYTLYYFNKLANHEPINLIDNPMLDGEYDDVSEISCLPIGTMLQSNILYNMFSNDSGENWYLLLDEIYLDDTGARYSKCYQLPVTFPFNYDEILKSQEERKYANVKGLKEKVYEGSYRRLQRLLEISLPELQQIDKYTSELTNKYMSIRKDIQKQAIKNTKFINLKLFEQNGNARFYFLTEATENPMELSKTKAPMDKELSKKEVDPETFELIDNPSHTYTLMFEIENLFPNPIQTSWLEVYDQDKEEVTIPILKEVINVADIKIFSTSPSFHWQGFNYRISSKENGSIYPTDIPDGFWGTKHGANAYLDKHLALMLSSGSFQIFFNQMISSLNKQLKGLGFVKSKKQK